MVGTISLLLKACSLVGDSSSSLCGGMDAMGEGGGRTKADDTISGCEEELMRELDEDGSEGGTTMTSVSNEGMTFGRGWPSETEDFSDDLLRRDLTLTPANGVLTGDRAEEEKETLADFLRGERIVTFLGRG